MKSRCLKRDIVPYINRRFSDTRIVALADVLVRSRIRCAADSPVRFRLLVTFPLTHPAEYAGLEGRGDSSARSPINPAGLTALPERPQCNTLALNVTSGVKS